jgi:hypothetical protein
MAESKKINVYWHRFINRNDENNQLLQHFLSTFTELTNLAYNIDFINTTPTASKELKAIKLTLSKLEDLELSKAFIKSLIEKNQSTPDQILDVLQDSVKDLKKEKVITKRSGFKSNGELTAPWQKFKNRLDNYKEVSIEKWTTEQLVGHTISRYKDYMCSDYNLSYNGAPLKSKEIYCLNRAAAMLSLSIPNMKIYIDWVFDKLIIPKKIIISSFGFFCHDNVVNAYKKEIKKNSKLSRTTSLPNEYDEIFESFGMSIYTYGDLSFAKQASECSEDENIRLMFLQLQQAGFDFEKLNELED